MCLSKEKERKFFFSYKTLFKFNFVICARVVCYAKTSDFKPNMKGWVSLHSICLTSCATRIFCCRSRRRRKRDFISLHRKRNKQNRKKATNFRIKKKHRKKWLIIIIKCIQNRCFSPSLNLLKLWFGFDKRLGHFLGNRGIEKKTTTKKGIVNGWAKCRERAKETT